MPYPGIETYPMEQKPYFKSENIADGVTAITGPGKELCYLVEGNDTALLIDSLAGVGNLKEYCARLTPLPIKVVNTHGHVDHTGGNLDFGACFIHPKEIGTMYWHQDKAIRKRHVMIAQSTLSNPIEIRDEDLTSPAPIYTYPVFNGDIFDLGDRRLTVIGVPGHSPGSIVLLDQKTRIVFSGDACNSNTLVIFGKGSTSIETYQRSLTYLKTYQPKFDVMYGGHKLTALPKSIIDESIELCQEIMEGRDDQFESRFLTIKCYYAKKTRNYQRLDGKIANIAYLKNNIFDTKEPLISVYE